MAIPVTETLVDAKDEARQAEVRTDIASALLKIREDRMFFVKMDGRRGHRHRHVRVRRGGSCHRGAPMTNKSALSATGESVIWRL